ncbi:hypothetical protein CRD60_02465 [Bifidobacterium aemilianum]|uniref:Uncharacterized protein n=1 Tax=Bifidobacterium aemilianum TaxID=2493120 RepID=A0A366K8L5_9BIFI|nr:hypothetical protein CRD60_02465 [Bifidobacterium aemilianum]
MKAEMDAARNTIPQAEPQPDTNKSALAIVGGSFGCALIVAHLAHYVSGSLLVGAYLYPLTWALMSVVLSVMAHGDRIHGKLATVAWSFLAVALVMARVVRIASGSPLMALMAYPALWLLMIAVMALPRKAEAES